MRWLVIFFGVMLASHAMAQVPSGMTQASEPTLSWRGIQPGLNIAAMDAAVQRIAEIAPRRAVEASTLDSPLGVISQMMISYGDCDDVTAREGRNCVAVVVTYVPVNPRAAFLGADEAGLVASAVSVRLHFANPVRRESMVEALRQGWSVTSAVTPAQITSGARDQAAFESGPFTGRVDCIPNESERAFTVCGVWMSSDRVIELATQSRDEALRLINEGRGPVALELVPFR